MKYLITMKIKIIMNKEKVFLILKVIFGVCLLLILYLFTSNINSELDNLYLAKKYLDDANKTLFAPFKGSGSELGDMWQGAKDNFSAEEFITFGLSGLANSIKTKSITKKATAGKKLSESEELVMEAVLHKNMIDLMRANDISKWK